MSGSNLRLKKVPFIFTLGISCTWILLACTQITLSDLPEKPDLLQIYIPISLANLTPELNRCSQEIPDLTIVVQEAPSLPTLISPGDILLSMSPIEQPAQTFQLSRDEISLIVHPSNQLKSLSLTGLRALYSGNIRQWSELPPGMCGNCQVSLLPSSAVEPWGYPAGFDIQTVFESGVGFLISQNLTHTAPNPKAILESVSRNPGAIGFLPRRWIDQSVRPITITDQHPLTFPILATTSTEPTGKERDFLLCVQEKINKP
jgi:hypothetical protein